jgi:hypothetical protein
MSNQLVELFGDLESPETPPEPKHQWLEPQLGSHIRATDTDEDNLDLAD